MTIKHLFPLAWPKLDLNFAAERTLDPRITFTRSSVGTYMDATGILRTAAEDEPRFDHSGTGKSLGLLIEESRTNHLPYSDLTNGLEEYDCDNSPSTEVNPEGVASCRRILADASTGTYRVGDAYGGVSSESTASVFVKMDTHPYVLIGSGGGGSSYTAAFNIDPAFTGDRLLGESGKGTFTNLGAGYESYANGWFRIWASGTSAGTAGWGVTLSPDENTFNINSWTAAGTEAIFAYGGQYEYAKFPTSYIATTGAAEDRAADICTIEGDNFSSWYNPNMGTLFLDMKRFPIETPHVFLCTAGGGYFISDQAGAMTLRNFQGKTYSFKTIPTDCKIASSYLNGTGFNTSFNGSVAGAVSDTDTFAGTQLEIGGGSNKFTSTYRSGNSSLTVARLAYYPRRLSDEQLQALTA